MTPWVLAAYLGAFGADAATTHAALAAGGREAVLTRHAVINDCVLAAEAAAGWWAYTKLKPQHPRLARVLLVSGLASHSGAAVVNHYGLLRETRP